MCTDGATAADGGGGGGCRGGATAADGGGGRGGGGPGCFAVAAAWLAAASDCFMPSALRPCAPFFHAAQRPGGDHKLCNAIIRCRRLPGVSTLSLLQRATPTRHTHSLVARSKCPCGQGPTDKLLACCGHTLEQWHAASLTGLCGQVSSGQS